MAAPRLNRNRKAFFRSYVWSIAGSQTIINHSQGYLGATDMPARDYRGEARTLLELARRELDSGDDIRLRYAALNLRLAMEAITYDRAYAYRAEIPPQEYETWQPKKVLQLLLEIDPNVDKDSTIRFGLEAMALT